MYSTCGSSVAVVVGGVDFAREKTVFRLRRYGTELCNRPSTFHRCGCFCGGFVFWLLALSRLETTQRSGRLIQRSCLKTIFEVFLKF